MRYRLLIALGLVLACLASPSHAKALNCVGGNGNGNCQTASDQYVDANGNAQDVDANHPMPVGTAFSTPILWSPTFTLGIGYVTGQDMGGLLSNCTLTANAWYSVTYVNAFIGAGTFTAGSAVNIGFRLFNDNPSSSTYTDTSAAVLNSGDKAKLIYAINVGQQAPPTVNNEPTSWTAAPARLVRANSSGCIYLAVIAEGTFTMTGPYGQVNVELRK